MLTDNGIVVRRTSYACCALSYLAAMTEAQKYGDTACVTKNRKLWLYMLFAKRVMDETPITGETNKCVDPAFAEQVAKKADCFCTVCGEGVPYPPVDECAIVVTNTVIAAVDVSDRAAIESAGPTVGDAYIVVTDSGGTVWTINTIQTWNGSGWTATAILDGQITQTEELPTPNYWVTLGGTGEPGLLFPTVTATWVGPPDLYIIQSDYPQVSEFMARTALIEVFGSGGWFTILQVPEQDLVDPIPFNIAGYDMSSIRTTYTQGDCSWQANSGSIEPPNCTFPRDHSCLSHSTLSHS